MDKLDNSTLNECVKNHYKFVSPNQTEPNVCVFSSANPTPNVKYSSRPFWEEKCVYLNLVEKKHKDLRTGPPKY